VDTHVLLLFLQHHHIHDNEGIPFGLRDGRSRHTTGSSCLHRSDTVDLKNSVSHNSTVIRTTFRIETLFTTIPLWPRQRLIHSIDSGQTVPSRTSTSDRGTSSVMVPTRVVSLYRLFRIHLRIHACFISERYDNTYNCDRYIPLFSLSQE
jgi:hypothetical protein